MYSITQSIRNTLTSLFSVFTSFIPSSVTKRSSHLTKYSLYRTASKSSRATFETKSRSEANTAFHNSVLALTGNPEGGGRKRGLKGLGKKLKIEARAIWKTGGEGWEEKYAEKIRIAKAASILRRRVGDREGLTVSGL